MPPGAPGPERSVVVTEPDGRTAEFHVRFGESAAELTSRGSDTWAARVMGGAATTTTDGKAGLHL